MINLLPTELKQTYRYGRRNRHLLHWVWALLTVLFGAILLTGAGYLYLRQSSEHYKKQIAVTEANLNAQQYETTEKDVLEMSNNLNLTVQVLSKQVMFSELLQQFGSLMPKDTRLQALNISQAQDAVDITARAKTVEAATQIQVNISSSGNKVFSKADIISITCDGNDAYPCSVNIRALLAKDNPFLFINDGKAKK